MQTIESLVRGIQKLVNSPKASDDEAHFSVLNNLWTVNINGTNIWLSNEREDYVRAILVRETHRINIATWRSRVSASVKENFAKVLRDPVRDAWGMRHTRRMGEFYLIRDNANVETIPITVIAEIEPGDMTSVGSAISKHIAKWIQAWYTLSPEVDKKLTNVSFFYPELELELHLHDDIYGTHMEKVVTFAEGIGAHILNQLIEGK